MKIQDVIVSALRHIGREDIALLLDDGDRPYGEQSEVVNTLLYCVHATEDELARYYFPLKCVETLNSQNGEFSFENFSHIPVRISKVMVDGREIEFTLTTKAVVAAAQRAEIEYYYVPEKKSMDYNCAFGDTFDNNITALGAAAEYCLICGEASLAEALETRYREAIERAQKASKQGAFLPPRRWV